MRCQRGNEERVTGNWRKGHRDKMAKNLAQLHSSVLWNLKLVSHENGYLAEEIFEQSG